MIVVENLVKKYGGHLAVDHLSFRVEPGKIYGFLGPNGAGKSTTMNIMTGYIAPTEGSVKINGYDIMKEAEEAKKCIGYLPEVPPLYQDMTVSEYLTFVARLKKIPGDVRKKQIEEVMALTMTSDMGGRLIKNLSKGYRQRVGLAQAVLGYPEVIILDEPTAGLDPKQIIEIRDLIKKLGENHTVILSSHILSEVQAVCDEIMIISRGQLVANDTPEGLTSLMKGAAGLELTVLGERERVMSVIKGFDKIRSYHVEEEKKENLVKLVLETDREYDIREELFYALAEKRLPMMSLNRLEKSLEDVFLELTETTSGADGTQEEKDAPAKILAAEAMEAERPEAAQEEEGGENYDGNL